MNETAAAPAPRKKAKKKANTKPYHLVEPHIFDSLFADEQAMSMSATVGPVPPPSYVDGLINDKPKRAHAPVDGRIIGGSSRKLPPAAQFPFATEHSTIPT